MALWDERIGVSEPEVLAPLASGRIERRRRRDGWLAGLGPENSRQWPERSLTKRRPVPHAEVRIGSCCKAQAKARKDAAKRIASATPSPAEMALGGAAIATPAGCAVARTKSRA